MSETLLDRLASALDDALTFDRNVGEPPIALLWPDESEQWAAAVDELQRSRRVVRYGTLDADQYQGPAYWLRCVIAGTVQPEGLPDGVPIVYLPGISRDTLRALDAIAPELSALGAIQYRCQWFSHPNGKDWTVRSLLANKDRGLNLNIASDPATTQALTDSLRPLLDQPINRLVSRHVDASLLNSLLSPDPVRSLLDWLDNPSGMRNGLSDREWAAFTQQCKQDFAFDPSSEGEIEGARRLGEADGRWAEVWDRFRENPQGYLGIPDRLRQADTELFPKNPGAWPAHSATEEENLRAALLALGDLSPQPARDSILGLEADHKARRGHVWADLGWTPLALALEHLAEAARIISEGVPGGTVEEIVDWYGSKGWRSDRAVLAALNETDKKPDLAAVEAAISSTYRPWLDAAAKSLQAAVGPMANSGTYSASPAPRPAAGQVTMFIDGLRLDVAHLLGERLAGAGLKAALETGLAALPTVTQTSKPALVPIDQTLLAAGSGLEARRAPDGPGAEVKVLRGLMATANIQVLRGTDELGDPAGTAWTEAGELDKQGHALGVRLAHEIDGQVQRIATRIEDLFDAGWRTVTVVTDHGWLLLPGGLPKNENLPIAATDTKKGRCARLKDGAAVSVPTVPWHWDNDVRIAVAPGISCFEANKDYEHGGVSPQECVVPRLTVTLAASPTAGAAITSMKWRGLALSVEFTDLPDGATLDLRFAPGDVNTSIAGGARPVGSEGKERILVGDEDLEDQPAYLVVEAADGSLLLQRDTIVGQNR